MRLLIYSGQTVWLDGLTTALQIAGALEQFRSAAVTVLHTATFRAVLNKITHQVRVGTPVQKIVPDNPVSACVFCKLWGQFNAAPLSRVAVLKTKNGIRTL